MGRIRKNPIDIMPVVKKTERQIIWNIAVYIRLSKEDGNDESESVINQKKILMEYLEQFFEGQYVIVDHYIEMITSSLKQLHYKGAKPKTLKHHVFQAFLLFSTFNESTSAFNYKNTL
jgi:hypothetical protein